MIMKDKKRLAIACTMTLVPIALIGGTIGLIACGISIIVTLIVLVTSNRSFGGITGDVLGATNEIIRLSSLIVFASI